MLTWTPALAIGVPELDAQHRELFLRADAFLEALERAVPGDVRRLLAFLHEHAVAHFRAEEAWMADARYPELAAHRAEHAGFLAQLEIYERNLILGGAAPVDVAAWVVRWLHDHVVAADTAAARFVRATQGEG